MSAVTVEKPDCLWCYVRIITIRQPPHIKAVVLRCSFLEGWLCQLSAISNSNQFKSTFYFVWTSWQVSVWHAFWTRKGMLFMCALCSRAVCLISCPAYDCNYDCVDLDGSSIIIGRSYRTIWEILQPSFWSFSMTWNSCCFVVLIN